jgi:large subunit ribosomal protein L6
MSRIGKEPVKLVEGVTALIDGQTVTVKGKLGELSYTMHDGITAKLEDGVIKIDRCCDSVANFHGLARALINNMVIGVSTGYTKQLSIEGTGFKAALQGTNLSLTLGFASPKIYQIPEGLTITVENDGLLVTVKGIRKEQVGEAAARIRAYYPAEQSLVDRAFNTVDAFRIAVLRNHRNGNACLFAFLLARIELFLIYRKRLFAYYMLARSCGGNHRRMMISARRADADNVDILAG